MAGEENEKENEKGGLLEKAEGEAKKTEGAVVSEVKKIEALSDADLRAAIRWILGALPPGLSKDFYDHHPRFKE